MSQAVCAAAAWCSNTERSQQCFKKKCVVTRQGIAFDMQMLQELKQEVGQGEEGGGGYQTTGAGSQRHFEDDDLFLRYTVPLAEQLRRSSNLYDKRVQ